MGPIIIYNHGSQILKKKSNLFLKLLGLYWFLHETWRFFEAFEIQGTSVTM
jgi:hypothetical protein